MVSRLTVAFRMGFPVANELYDIFMAYESPAAGSNFGVRLSLPRESAPFHLVTVRRVFWKSIGSSRAEDDAPLEVIPAAYLHSADDVTGNSYYSSAGHASPKVVTTVEPGATCSSFSFASGSAITLATAGIAATFTVTVKDSWDNLKTSSVSTVITAAVVQQGSFNLAAAAVPTAVSATPTYTIAYTLTTSSAFSISVLCNNQGIIGSAFSLTVFPANECGKSSFFGNLRHWHPALDNVFQAQRLHFLAAEFRIQLYRLRPPFRFHVRSVCAVRVPHMVHALSSARFVWQFTRQACECCCYL